MGTFRSRCLDSDVDGRLGDPDAAHPEHTQVIPNSDVTMLIARWERPYTPDPPLLPAWLFRSLVVTVFAIIYGLTLFGVFVIYKILTVDG